MRATILNSLVFVGVLMISGVGAAEPFSGAFDELRDHLTPRRLLLQDATAKPDKKRRNAVEKALKLVDKNSKSVAQDLARARQVYRKLAKAYGDTRFLDDTGGTGSLEDYLGDMAYSFEDEVLDHTDTLAERLEELPDGKHRRKAEKFSEKAQEALEVADESQDDIAAFLKALRKTEVLAAKGTKAADKAEK